MILYNLIVIDYYGGQELEKTYGNAFAYMCFNDKCGMWFIGKLFDNNV